jgi:CRP/FNR family transcriptional regulator, cyclic AMP receptor protein
VSTIHLFDNAGDAVVHPAGTVIFREGEPGDCMYAVVEGEVEILLGDNVVDSTGPGGIVGEMAVIDAGPRSATCRARTDVKLVAVNQRRFLFLVQQTPFFAVQVMQILSDRHRRRLATIR